MRDVLAPPGAADAIQIGLNGQPQFEPPSRSTWRSATSNQSEEKPGAAVPVCLQRQSVGDGDNQTGTTEAAISSTGYRGDGEAEIRESREHVSAAPSSQGRQLRRRSHATR